jgi:hypothetical protein
MDVNININNLHEYIHSYIYIYIYISHQEYCCLFWCFYDLLDNIYIDVNVYMNNLHICVYMCIHIYTFIYRCKCIHEQPTHMRIYIIVYIYIHISPRMLLFSLVFLWWIAVPSVVITAQTVSLSPFYMCIYTY